MYKALVPVYPYHAQYFPRSWDQSSLLLTNAMFYAVCLLSMTPHGLSFGF